MVGLHGFIGWLLLDQRREFFFTGNPEVTKWWLVEVENSWSFVGWWWWWWCVGKFFFCDVDVYYTYTVFCWNIPMAWVRACDLAGSTWPLPLQYWSECWLMARRFFSNQKASPTLSSSRTLLSWVILVYTVGDEILPSHVEIFHQPI